MSPVEKGVVTPENPEESESESLQDTVFPHCLDHESTARRGVNTGWGEVGRDDEAIEVNREEKKLPSPSQ